MLRNPIIIGYTVGVVIQFPVFSDPFGTQNPLIAYAANPNPSHVLRLASFAIGQAAVSVSTQLPSGAPDLGQNYTRKEGMLSALKRVGS